MPGPERTTAPATASRIPYWLPDAVTLLRIALIPLVVVAAEATKAAVAAGTPSAPARAATLLLLLGIGASDKLDGWLARRSGRPPSRRGAILDAAADRLVQWTGAWFFALRAWPAFTALPLWFPLVIVGRDAVLLLAWLRGGRPTAVSVEHEVHGKAATVVVFLVLVGAAAAVPERFLAVAAAVAAGVVVYSTGRYAGRAMGGGG